MMNLINYHSCAQFGGKSLHNKCKAEERILMKIFKEISMLLLVSISFERFELCFILIFFANFIVTFFMLCVKVD